MTIDSISAERKTLGEIVYQKIRNKIISLDLKPGEMIYENPIASEYGVSRTPVREAMNMLAQEGLIEIFPQRGARVAFLSVAKLQEAQFVRESLEISVFFKVAEVWDASKDNYKQAEEEIVLIIQNQKDSIEIQDYLQFVRLDEDFHNTIINLSGNHTLLTIVKQMRDYLNRLRYLELQEAHHEKVAITQHEEIFKAIKNNDAMYTIELLKQHLNLVNEDFRSRIFENHRDMFI
jgi:DNA-binding GntR family transcriptional regulator